MIFCCHIRSTPSPCFRLIGVLVMLSLSCGPKQVDFTSTGRIVYVDHTDTQPIMFSAAGCGHASIEMVVCCVI